MLRTKPVSPSEQRASRQSYSRSKIQLNADSKLMTTVLPSEHNGEDKYNISKEGIYEMISLLRQYEQLCISKQDFGLAEEAKNKIMLLKGQSLLMRKEQLSAKEKYNVDAVCKEGEQYIKHFQYFWDVEVQQLISNLKEIYESLMAEQLGQRYALARKLEVETVSRVKYSPKVLEMRKYLTSLIKARNYREAENVKNKLMEIYAEYQNKWYFKFQYRKKTRLYMLYKKQQGELQALRVRLEGAFNYKIKYRDSKFEILLKKNRKRRIESSKITRYALRTKNMILNESKCYTNLNNSRC